MNVILIVFIVIILIVVIIILAIALYYAFKENSESNNDFKKVFNFIHEEHGEELPAEDIKTIGVVISRYNEDLSYLNDIKQKLEQCGDLRINFYIYNKGTEIEQKNVKLDNIGMCDHTYLYHIIENYDNLDDVTCFLPGSCFINSKANLTESLLQKCHKYEYLFTCTRKEELLFKFELDKYQCTDKRNRSSSAELALCPIRPYSKWYLEIMNKELYSNMVNYRGIFSVSKEKLIKNDRKLYQKLIGYLSKDKRPEASHFMERLWFNLVTDK